MQELSHELKTFITEFSTLTKDEFNLPKAIELPPSDKFPTTKTGIEYVGNILKDINNDIYNTFLKMLKNNITFTTNYDVHKSVCKYSTILGVTTDVNIYVPHITNPMNLFAFSHELGHGLTSFTKLKGERHFYSNCIFDETIPILFGKLCTNRYIKDFGYDHYIDQFDLLNIKNALKCLYLAKLELNNYIKQEENLNNLVSKKENYSNTKEYSNHKLYTEKQTLKKLQEKIHILISYPIGIALTNMYDNFSQKEQEEYLTIISKYLLNSKHINYQTILDDYNIQLDSTFYINNTKEYIKKYEKIRTKLLNNT